MSEAHHKPDSVPEPHLETPQKAKFGAKFSDEHHDVRQVNHHHVEHNNVSHQLLHDTWKQYKTLNISQQLTQLSPQSFDSLILPTQNISHKPEEIQNKKHSTTQVTHELVENVLTNNHIVDNTTSRQVDNTKTGFKNSSSTKIENNYPNNDHLSIEEKKEIYNPHLLKSQEFAPEPGKIQEKEQPHTNSISTRLSNSVHDHGELNLRAGKASLESSKDKYPNISVIPGAGIRSSGIRSIINQNIISHSNPCLESIVATRQVLYSSLVFLDPLALQGTMKVPASLKPQVNSIIQKENTCTKYANLPETTTATISDTTRITNKISIFPMFSSNLRIHKLKEESI